MLLLTLLELEGSDEDVVLDESAPGPEAVVEVGLTTLPDVLPLVDPAEIGVYSP